MRAGQMNNPNTQNGSAPRVVESQRWAVSQCGSFYCLLDGQVFCFFFFFQNKNNNHKTPRSDSLGGKRASSLPSWVFSHLSCDCASSIARQLASHLPLSSKAKLPPRFCFSYIPTVVLSKKVIAGARLFILILPQMAFILFRPRHTSSKIYFKWMGSLKKKKSCRGGFVFLAPQFCCCLLI